MTGGAFSRSLGFPLGLRAMRFWLLGSGRRLGLWFLRLLLL